MNAKELFDDDDDEGRREFVEMRTEEEEEEEEDGFDEIKTKKNAKRKKGGCTCPMSSENVRARLDVP